MRLMTHTLKKFLKQWRDNYFLSSLLAYCLKPLHSLSARTASFIHRRIRKNGAAIRLPNGKKMTIGRDSGIGLASELFWHGFTGYEPETSRTLRNLFERSATFIDVGANC